MLTTDKERVSARIPRESRNLLEKAAALSGATLNQFVVQAAVKEAQALLSREQTFVFPAVHRELFCAGFAPPPPPTGALRKAAKAYRRSRLHAQD